MSLVGAIMRKSFLANICASFNLRNFFYKARKIIPIPQAKIAALPGSDQSKVAFPLQYRFGHSKSHAPIYMPMPATTNLLGITTTTQEKIRHGRLPILLCLVSVAPHPGISRRREARVANPSLSAEILDRFRRK
jgi:hypothetical protein